MNKNSETRIECTDWDEEVPVATWTKGCGRKPARKVITKGVAKVELTKAQTERIAKMLGSGMEVRLAVVTKSEQVADNKGDDENKPVQANPVSVETKVK